MKEKKLKAIDTKAQMMKVINKEKLKDVRVHLQAEEGYIAVDVLLKTEANRDIWVTKRLCLEVKDEGTETLDFGTGDGSVVEGNFDWDGNTL